MAEKLEFKFDLLKGQTTIIEALDEASKKATGFKAVLGDVSDSGTSFLKLSSAVAVGTAAFEFAKVAVSKFVGILEDGIDAAIEKENAINKLNISLAQTGKYTTTASADIQAYAEELRKTTRYTDDQILSNAAYLQSLTYLDTKGLKQATKASADLAATLGIDLSSATSLVAKSIEGNTGALSRYGIQVKKGADETENFNNTLRALSQFAGRAEADANTFGGAVTRMSNALGEVSSSLGMVITKNPIFISTINQLGEAFNKLSEYINKNQGNLIQFVNTALRSFGEGILQLAPVFSFIVKSLDSMLGIIRLSIQGWSQLLEVMSGLQIITNIVGTFVTGLLEIPKGLAMLIQYMAELAASSSFMSKAFDKAGISIDKVSKDYTGLINKIEDLQVEVASVDFDKSTIQALDNMDGLLEKSQTFLKDQTNAVKTIGNEIIKVSNVTLDQQKQRIQNNQNIIVQSENFFERFANAFSSFGKVGQKLSDIFTKIDRSTGLTQFEQLLDTLGPALSGAVTKGAAGAQKFIGDAAQGIGNMFGKGIGDAIRPFLDMFMQGPEYTKKMIKEFNAAIPVIIENIIASIPALIEGLIESFPGMLIRLATYIGTGQFIVVLARGLLKAFASIPKYLSTAIIDGLKGLPKTLVGSFIMEMPRIIAEFIKGAASFGSYILQGAIQFIGYLISGAGSFIFEIVKGAGSFVWTIIQGASSFVGEILRGAASFVWEIIAGAGRFVSELVSQIPVVGGIFGGGGGGGGGILGDIGGAISSVFDWSKGGEVKPVYAAQGMITPYIPKGTDTVPSMLTPGEYVVDRSTSGKLNKFLESQSNQSQNSIVLNQILFELKKPQTITSEITINRKTFADLILELNRSNARLTA